MPMLDRGWKDAARRGVARTPTRDVPACVRRLCAPVAVWRAHYFSKAVKPFTRVRDARSSKGIRAELHGYGRTRSASPISTRASHSP